MGQININFQTTEVSGGAMLLGYAGPVSSVGEFPAIPFDPNTDLSGPAWPLSGDFSIEFQINADFDDVVNHIADNNALMLGAYPFIGKETGGMLEPVSMLGAVWQREGPLFTINNVDTTDLNAADSVYNADNTNIFEILNITTPSSGPGDRNGTIEVVAVALGSPLIAEAWFHWSGQISLDEEPVPLGPSAGSGICVVEIPGKSTQVITPLSGNVILRAKFERDVSNGLLTVSTWDGSSWVERQRSHIFRISNINTSGMFINDIIHNADQSVSFEIATIVEVGEAGVVDAWLQDGSGEVVSEVWYNYAETPLTGGPELPVPSTTSANMGDCLFLVGGIAANQSLPRAVMSSAWPVSVTGIKVNGVEL